MKIFGFKKRKDLIDLTEHYKKQQEKKEYEEALKKGENEIPQTSDSNSSFNFLKNLASSSQGNTDNDSDYVQVSETDYEKKRKLAKRLMDMTTKMEELSNQIYHIQQRIELLEKKLNVSRF